MKNTKLADKEGKILVFGGVYSNLQALEALKAKAENLQIAKQNIFCTGDIVGYCAQPNEVVQFIKKWGINSIAGNVELQLAEGEEDCGCDFNEGSRCDLFSKQWYPYAQSQVSQDSLNYIKKLPELMQFSWEGEEIAIVHGSAFETSEFIFKSSPWELKQRNFDKLNVNIILAGHCGLPFHQQKNGQWWINAGVIGMPANDGNTHVWYASLEKVEGKLKVEHHSLNYDNNTANQLMQKAQLPEAYAKTLLSGIWDNCEILPESETNEQGKVIQF